MAENKMNPPLDPPDRSSLEAKIILALEMAPQPEIRSDFASRVAGRVSLRAAQIPGARRYGHNAAIVSMGVLLALMLAFAHRATGASLVWISIEWIFCAQFALLAVWLVAWEARLYSRS
jgi:hypothetical protein